MSPVLYFLGDVYLPTPIECKIDFPGAYTFNLEAPITRRGKPAPGKINLRCEENHLRESFERLPVAVCLANNHIMDFGAEGLEDTLAALTAMNVRWYGAGTVGQNCGNPLILELGGVRVAFLGYVCASTHPVWASQDTPGVMPIVLEQIRADITSARRSRAVRIVVSFHWGDEEVSRPKPEDVAIAHETIMAGADLVVSHHAHCIQSYEVFNTKSIFYGLGNSVFPSFELPSFYDHQGRPTRKAEAHWYSWNANSMVVRYDVQNGQVQISGAKFSGNRLIGSALRPNNYYLGSGENLKSKYETARRYSTARRAFVSFMREPRLRKLKVASGVLKRLLE